MTPRAFLSRYRFDRRMVDGSYFPRTPLALEPGDHVGIVLFNLGGPRSPDEIEPFLYNLFMDPAIIDIPLPAFLRDKLCRTIARRRSATVREEYGLIGGASPINAHTERQAETLRERMAPVGERLGVRFSVHAAMRYGWPTSEEAAAAMRKDGVTKVVLLPLYPQYSKTTTGASLVYWSALVDDGTADRVPTVAVFDYAAHPSLVAAFNARIDEGLARFPAEERASVHLLFSAHGTPLYEMTKRGDPYCCQVHATVEHVMDARTDGRPFRVAFQSKVGPAEWLTPSTPHALEEMAHEGVRHVLVVPIAFVSDHVETAFELDMEVRKEAEAAGIERYEVMTGLNDHPAFIEALADVVTRHCAPGPEPRPYPAAKRSLACHQCRRNGEASCWT